MFSDTSAASRKGPLRFAAGALMALALWPANALAQHEPAAASAAVHSVTSETFLAPVQTEAEAEGLTGRDVQATTGFADALGRAAQTVAVEATPAGRDLVTPVTRDALGRAVEAHLPYERATGGGGLVEGALGAQQAFYASPPDASIAPTNYPSSETVYETSPLGRTVEAGAVGYAWQPGGGHTVRTRHRTNSADEVRRYEIMGGGVSVSGHYAPGALAVTEVTDANDNRSEVFTDREGREALKRSFLDGEAVETYYLYDERGLLRYVVPPEAAKEVEGGALFEDVRGRWVTEYVYDGLGREVEKLMPEEEAVTTVYDRMGRVALRQDGVFREAGQWLFFKYDRYGREVMTGVFTPLPPLSGDATARRQAMQSTLDGMDVYHEGRDGAAEHGYTTDRAYPREGTDGELLVWRASYYDDYDWPGLESLAYEPDGEFTTLAASDPAVVDNPTAEAHPAAPFARLRGRVTGTKVRVLGEEGGAPAANVLTGSAYDAAPPEPDTVYFKPEGGRVTLLPGFTSRPGQVLFIGANIDVPDHLEAGAGSGLFLASARYYDRRGRVIQTRAENRLGGRETASTLYDFAGRVVKAKHTHTAPSPYERTLTVRTRSAYDEGGRLARTWQQNDGEAEVQVAAYRYDALGRTEEKRLHVTGSAAAQTLAYRYHERGWLSSMEAPGLFELGLHYDGLPYRKAGSIGQARYDGSISVQTWQQSHLEGYDQAYAYQYDDLGRVAAAQRYEVGFNPDLWAPQDAFTLDAASYDLHGNLKQVRRHGQSGAVIDDLAYGYGAAGASGNQLTSVSDAAPGTDGHDFADGSGTCAGGAEYAYDPNGNLECDGDRGIEIRYNYLNLPEEVTWSDGRRIAWTYDATGSKLRKQVYDATGSLTLGVDYAGGGVVYEQQAGESAPDLAYFPMAEGRVVADASAGSGSSDYAYEYQVHDHLGSLRAAFRPDAPTAAVQWADYYPYGLRMAGRYGTSGGQENKALYNGKELEDDHDLGWYHYGVRYYDVRLAKWHAMDPADEFHSPYVYVGGDPVNLVDPDGAQAWRASNRLLQSAQANAPLTRARVHAVAAKYGITDPDRHFERATVRALSGVTEYNSRLNLLDPTGTGIVFKPDGMGALHQKGLNMYPLDASGMPTPSKNVFANSLLVEVKNRKVTLTGQVQAQINYLSRSDAALDGHPPVYVMVSPAGEGYHLNVVRAASNAGVALYYIPVYEAPRTLFTRFFDFMSGKGHTDFIMGPAELVSVPPGTPPDVYPPIGHPPMLTGPNSGK